MNLDSAQAQAVHAKGKDILALACAGSGKTRTLVERIAHRIETDTPPWAVMAITFTNKAAEEMRERLAKRLGQKRAAQVWMGTFHAFGLRVLTDFCQQTGFPEGVSVYDEDDVTDVLRLCIHQLGVPVAAKSPDAETFRKAAERVGKTELLETAYRATLRRYAATDYDGLELHLLELLKNRHVVEWVERFRDALVDEFQDTSPVQQEILDALRRAVPALRIFMCGDEVQAIYSFRGATIENIQRAADRPDTQTVRLNTNYRSGVAVVEAGNRISAAAGGRLGRVEPGPAAGPGDVRLDQHADVISRALAIADQVQAYIAAGGKPSDVMVLGRTWGAVDPVTQALKERGVPVDSPKDEADRWSSEPMRWLVGAMRLWRNPRDGISLRRVLRWPAPTVTERQLGAAEMASNAPILEATRAAGLGAERLGFLGSDRLLSLRDPHEFAVQFVRGSDARRLLEEQGRTTRRDELDESVEMLQLWCERRLEDYRAGRSEEHSLDVARFIRWWTFREVRDAQKKETVDAVRVLTIHAAKGLEADVVHFVGPDHGVFPRPNADNPAEELRLWYVAITRARSVFAAHTSAFVPASWGYKVVPAGPSEFVRFLEAAS